MKAILLSLSLLLIAGCEGGYRYPCQDPVNKDKEECNRPACEADGYCYDALNGLPPQEEPEQQVESQETADCNCEQKGE